jgi:hypothetical protein
VVTKNRYLGTKQVRHRFVLCKFYDPKINVQVAERSDGHSASNSFWRQEVKCEVYDTGMSRVGILRRRM